MNAPIPFVYLMAPPSLRCVWNPEERAFQCLFDGFPFESCLAHVIQTAEGGHLIKAWIEVDETDDGAVLAYALPIPCDKVGDADEVAKRLFEAVCLDWFES